MSNRKDGLAFEREFCSELATYGFWVTNLPQSVYGQPADVIAARNGVPYLIDCKLVGVSKRFVFNRVEPNQMSAMSRWLEKVNTNPMFAVKVLDEKPRMIPYNDIVYQSFFGKASLGWDEIRVYPTLEEWVSECQ